MMEFLATLITIAVGSALYFAGHALLIVLANWREAVRELQVWKAKRDARKEDARWAARKHPAE